MNKVLIAFLLGANLVFLGCGSGGGGPQGGFAAKVVVAKAVSEKVQDAITVVGTLAANEFVEIQSEVEGLVEEVEFEEGQKVEAGKVLFRIDQVKLETSVREAEANYNLAASNLKRSHELVKKRTISAQAHEKTLSEFRASKATLDRTRRQLDDALLKTPFEGIMGARLVSAGQFVQKGKALSTIVSLHPMKLEFQVPERFIRFLEPGVKIDAVCDAYPDKPVSGEVFFVSPHVDQSTRTVLVKAKVPNEEGVLKAGLFANINLVFSERDSAVVIPESAVMFSRKGTIVFTVDEKDLAQIRPVTVGLRLKGKVEILAGLKPGELVISEGTQKTRPGAPVAYEGQVKKEELPQNKA